MHTEWNPKLGVLLVEGMPEELLKGHTPHIEQWNDHRIVISFELETTPPKPSTRFVDMVSSVTRERQDNYGRPLINFLRIGMYWTVYLRSKGKLVDKARITPEDVSWLMILLKTARGNHSWSDDNVLDTLGYADCLDDMNRHMLELGFSMGLKAIDHFSEYELAILMDQLNGLS